MPREVALMQLQPKIPRRRTLSTARNTQEKIVADSCPSYIVHLAGRFLVVVTKAGHRRHVVVVLALGPGFVRCLLGSVLLDIFCKDSAPVANRR